MSVPSVDIQKKQLRKRAHEIRSNIALAASPDGQAAFERNLYQILDQLADWQVVSGYLAIGDEIDLGAVLQHLVETGKTCVLPVVVGKQKPLVFRPWAPGCALENGPLKTRHPKKDSGQIDPQVLLVPLLAFDRQGYRLGWGGGFYDRTLLAYQQQGRAVTTIGIAYGGQEVDRVPYDLYDQRIDYVVTEHDVIKTENHTSSNDSGTFT